MIHTKYTITVKKKGVKVPAMQKASNPSNKREREIKPIIIDDTPIINDVLSVNMQQNCTKAKLPTSLTTPATNQSYPQPFKRPPPSSAKSYIEQPQELMDLVDSTKLIQK